MDVVDISPEIVTLALEYFGSFNNDLGADERVTIHLDDGRAPFALPVRTVVGSAPARHRRRHSSIAGPHPAEGAGTAPWNEKPSPGGKIPWARPDSRQLAAT